MTIPEMIDVLSAYMEGKKIEVRPVVSPHYWSRSATTPIWNFADYDYRVAPEPRKPREWWVYIDNGEIKSCLTREFNVSIPARAIKVREVLENE